MKFVDNCPHQPLRKQHNQGESDMLSFLTSWWHGYHATYNMVEKVQELYEAEKQRSK